MEELVFAIPTNELWKLITYKEQGFIKADSEVLARIIQKGLFRKRVELEEDPSFKQIIPYAIISNNGSFFLFRRTSKQQEKRLHNKLTLGVGGHMNPANSNESGEQYLLGELKRELFEEVKFVNDCTIDSIQFIGYINDDTIPVGRHHIGLLYSIHISNKDIFINESEKMTAEWVDKTHLEKYYEEMETWSRIAFEYFS